MDEHPRPAVVEVPPGSLRWLWIAVGILALIIVAGALIYGRYSGWGPLARKGWTDRAGWSATVGRRYGPSVPQESALTCQPGKPSFLYYNYGSYWRDPPRNIARN